MVPFEKSKTVSFASSILKKNCVFSSRSRLPVKLICRITFGSACSFRCSFKSIAINF